VNAQDCPGTINAALAIGVLGYWLDETALEPCTTGAGLWYGNGQDIYFNTGDVGIGIDNVRDKLHVHQGAILMSTVGQTMGPTLKFDNDIAHWSITLAPSPWNRLSIFEETGTPSGVPIPERLTILPGGDVGIGTHQPKSQLHISAGNGDSLVIDANSQGGAAMGPRIAFVDTNLGDVDSAPVWEIKASGDKFKIGRRDMGLGGAFTFPVGFVVDNLGNVGIGTDRPDVALKVVGNVEIGNESASASGANAVAIGDGTTASGMASTAMGYYTTASGMASTAMGWGTTASGMASTAIGGGTIASGGYSTAIGDLTTASGIYSTAIGSETTASGLYSTAMGGRHIEAQGDYSIAVGLDDLYRYPEEDKVVSQDNTMAIIGGKVGIGTTTPQSTLAVSGLPTSAPDTSGTRGVLCITNDGNIWIDTDTGNGVC